jgi:beta-N-acetylhexosaminidase
VIGSERVRDETAEPGRPDDVLGLLMLAWDGQDVPSWLAARFRDRPPAGVTLFRHHNVGSPTQLRELTDALQADAPAGRPFLVAADQEGGQFLALGEGPTAFAGAMALGAAASAELAERVGLATGRELAALGVNVAYAPVLDVATNPANRSLGTRSFGSDPAAVAELGSAVVRGLQAAGVAATVKHFPGAGDVTVDPHHALGIVDHGLERLEAVELTPFRAAIDAGARLVMSGHLAVPAMTGRPDLPATLASDVMTALLRDRLGFAGVSITDALDMHALAQGPSGAVDVIAAVRAGVDLLLCAVDDGALERTGDALVHAVARGVVEPAAVERSLARVDALRRWVGRADRPEISLVGGAAHRALSRELAERALTIVRDEVGLLPLRPLSVDRLLAVMPEPTDLTPADTSSTVRPGLAAALRAHHASVDEIVVGRDPSDAEIAAVREAAAESAIVVVGTIAATPGSRQAALVDALLATDRPVVTVALRTPYDLAAYPSAGTHACTYSILPDPLAALAGALFGRGPAGGRLPAPIPGLYRAGHRWG